ncbi:MAG: ABC-F family ATP-binding cassette domain-containing protein [Parachlamydiaceae bacterium]
MIHVEDLTMEYQGHVLFENASFMIQEGERCGLVGRNGSGKTTLFRLLTGEETPYKGEISMKKGYLLGILKQHISFTAPTLIEEAILGLRESERDELYKVERILFGLGFNEEDLMKSPENFSGGYQLRLHLAKVLASEPDCLLLDEPTNYLDILSIRWFTKFLKQWRGEFILISHDREFMDSVSTTTMGIHRQKVRKMKGSSVEFFEKILQEEEIHERTAVNLEKKREHLQSFVDRFGAKATKAAQANARKKMIDRIPVLEKLKELYQLDFHFNEAYFPGRMMIEAKNMCFTYPQTETIIANDFSLEIEKGERIAIIGKNGRGKSTILKLLAGELIPDEGSIKRSENLKIGYFGQTNIDRLHPKNTIEEEISAANRSLNKTQIKSICGLMMFSGDKANKTTSMLSGGEKSRVLLGKILATPSNLLLLDEPTHHLDMESIEALIDALEDFQGSVAIVTHSELILQRLELDKIIVCHEGYQESFLGNYQDFLEKNGWEEKANVSKSDKKAKDKRENQQAKTNGLNEKAKLLKPIVMAIEAKEKAIVSMEQELNQLHQEVAEQAKNGEGQTIRSLSKEIALKQTTIDSLYQQLEKLIEEHQCVEAKF